MRERLTAIAEPLLCRVIGHPFWDGLRRGTLPAESLWHFAEQDARYVVPAYARALARAAAVAGSDTHAALICSAATATFDSLPRMGAGLTALAEELGGRHLRASADPACRAYASFMVAAGTASFHAAIGGLLPMSLFHLKVCDDLRERHVPDSRYAAWIDQYCPGDGYREYVEAYLDMIDEVAGKCSAGEQNQLAEHFLHGARHEWEFAEAAWRVRTDRAR